MSDTHSIDSTGELALPPVVTTPRLTMRSWQRDDAPALQRVLAASDAHLRPWTPWVIDGRTPGLSLEERLAQHAASFAEGKEWVYGMFDVDGNILGACGLYRRVGAGALEIGYWLAETAVGRGYATEAAGELTRLALELPGIERVEIRCKPDNRPSVGIAIRLGYRLTTTAETASDVEIWSRGRD